MKLREVAYSDQELNKLFQLLQHQLANVPGSRYEIMVDDFPIVYKTGDVEQFKTFGEFIYSDTETLTISFFDGLGKIISRTILRFKEKSNNPENSNNGLGNIPEGMSVQEWKLRQKQEWQKELEHEKRLNEMETLQALLKSKDASIIRLTKELEEAKKEKSAPAAFLGTMLMDGVLKHPKISGFLKETPLAGIVGEEQEETEEEETESQEATENAGVSIKPKQSSGKEESVVDVQTLTPEEIETLKFFKCTFGVLDDQQQDSLRFILLSLSKNPHAIGNVIKNLGNYLKQKPTQTNEKV